MIRMILLSLATLIGCLASDAQACARCGIFGRGCRMQQSTYYKPIYYQPVAAVVQQPSVFVVQNNYPQPIAQQGQTVYGYQAVAASFTANHDEFARQSAELAKAAGATFQLSLNGYNQVAQTQMAFNAQIAEPLVRGQAAAQVLTAAGLNRNAQSAPTQSIVRVWTDPTTGQARAEPLTSQQYQQQYSARIETSIGNGQTQQPTPSRDPPPIPGPERSTVVAQKCAKCHGLNLREPKGGVILDAGHGVSCDTFREAMLRMSSTDPTVRMPPDGNLTPQEAGDILQELLVLSKPRTE